jgi:hypothetical protein
MNPTLEENKMRLTMLSIVTVLVLSIASLSACAAIARHHEILSHDVVPQTESTDQISGEWNVSFFVHGETTPGNFKLRLDGKKVTGTAYSEHTGPGTVVDGVWQNDKLSFTLKFDKHESIAITGFLQDGKLVGEFRTEGFVSNWEAKKK